MRYVSLDGEQQPANPKKTARRPQTQAATIAVRLNKWFIIGGILLFLLLVGGYYAWSLLSGLKIKASEFLKAPNAIVNYVANKDPQVLNEDGRTNIALLGIGGKGHDGPYLTDTMIVASVNIKNGNVVLISLPRDIWVQSTASKLNAVYAYGVEKGDGIGLKQAKEELSKIVGLPIHYGLRIDFSGFEKMIDLVGGLDITVDTAFTDPQYPIGGKERDMCGYKEIEEKIASDSGEITVKKIVDANNAPVPENVNPYACRFEVLTFKKGPVTLDGKTALKFVRSRHGNNNEGSDFARSRRQEKVISALKAKILSTETLLNPTKVGPLLNTFGASIETDIQATDYGEFFKIVQKANDAKIVSHNISAEGTDALLRVPIDSSPYRGAYVLIPAAGANDWSGVAESVKNWIYQSENPTPSTEASASASPSNR
jgi:polyisoprenyl-teichoic acid--peptidoglycan teichoic acid transferase